MASVDFLAAEIAKRYGTVTRARGCFLYTRKGVRLVDLYQEGGRAILGWGGKTVTVFKNVLSRGITGSYDTDYGAHIAKATERLLGSRRAVFLFSDYGAALRAALSFSKSGTSFWKPWNGIENWHEISCVIIEPPFAYTPQLFILAIDKELFEAQLAAGNSAPDSVRIPAPLAAAASRAIHDMIAALPQRAEKDWFVYDKILTRYFTRKGPYLFPKIEQQHYEQFVCHCLDCHVVISPNLNTPSIVPFGADSGVFSLLKKNQFDAGGSDAAT